MVLLDLYSESSSEESDILQDIASVFSLEKKEKFLDKLLYEESKKNWRIS